MANELRGRFNIRFVACAKLHQLEVSHDQVGKLVAFGRLTRAAKNFEFIQLHDFVFIVLECEDRTIDRAVWHHNDEVFARNTENTVHLILAFFINQLFTNKQT
jgi:hypothetical protein